jgi:formylglycine-generating enzyme required for sulfatase activity
MTPIDYASKASIGLTKYIPGSGFTMGSRFHPREAPARFVFVSEFEMAHIPVMVSQYAVFVESGAVNEQRWWDEAGWAWLNGELDGWGRENRRLPDGWDAQKKKTLHPVVGVTAYEAEAYCKWLSAQKNKIVRLPSEEEWEYAARGDDRRPFPWGEEFELQRANTAEKELFETLAVGSSPSDSSPFGVLDMGGNVQQWTSSPYTALPDEIQPPGVLRVARGGSFNDTIFGSRTSYRRAYPPGYFYPFLGFRLVVGNRSQRRA